MKNLHNLSSKKPFVKFSITPLRFIPFWAELMPRHLKHYLAVFLFCAGISTVDAQNIGINSDGSSPDASAGLDIKFTDKGLLIPRVALTSTGSATPITSPVTSLIVYNTATTGDVTPGYYYWDGTAWLRLLGSNNAWQLTGNTGTTAGTNFIGTTDAKDFVVKTNNTEKLRVLSDGNVGIGTASADDQLDVVGSTQISEYLKVGNPTEPIGADVDNVLIYHIDFGSDNDQWWNYILSICNTTDGGLWYYAADYMLFDNIGNRHWRGLTSPYIWLPPNVNTSALRVEINHASTLEDGYDGTYLQWDPDNDGIYSIIDTWSSYGYNASINGTDPSTCSGDLNQNGWDDDMDEAEDALSAVTSVSNALSGASAASWVKFQLVGMEDESNNTGEYRVYEFWLYCDDMSFGTSGFEPGGIYAQGHVFAQSNSQIGDVAEYFPVKGKSVPGNLIAMDKSGTSNLCHIATKEIGNLVIGVHSTSPSVLVNSPSEGIPVAISGRVPVNVCNANGNIMPGDYLTASSIPGYAVKATEPCFVIGRAMERFDKETGQVSCMIGTGWYNPNSTSEGVVSGSASIPARQKTFKVMDNRISAYSRVFVTMRGDPGTYYWINNVSDGSFDISFNSETQNSITIDYLVNNANTINEIKNVIEKEIINQKVVNNNVNNDCGQEGYYIDKSGNRIDGIAVSENPPSAPPDVNKVWTWDAVNGFKELNVDYNTRIDLQRKTNDYKNSLKQKEAIEPHEDE